MAELYAIGDLGVGDLWSDAEEAAAGGLLSAFDPLAGAVVSDASGGDTSGGDTSGDTSGGGVPLGEGDFGGGTVLASGSVGGGASPVVFTGGSDQAVQEVIGGGTSVTGGGGGAIVPNPAAPIGPGTTTPTTSTPWVKYGIGVAVVAAVAYFVWKKMGKRRANPRRRRKTRRGYR